MDGDADTSASADLHRAILDHLPDGVIALDASGAVFYRNQAARDLADDTLPVDREQLDVLLEHRRRLTSVHWQPDSHSYTVDGVPLPGGAVLVIRDTREQYEARKALEQRMEQFRLLTEHAPTGVAILRDGTCVYANAAFEDIAGVDASGDRFLDHVHPDDRATVRGLIEKADGDIQPACTIRLRTPGGIVWVECTAARVTYQGHPGLLVNLMDVTRHRELEDEYLRSRRRMEQAVERERRFIEDVSHHFFNPLCIAKGYLNLSMRDVDPEVQRKLQITRDAVDRMENVVKNVVRDGTICE
ncbi:MAG: PAS domain S-box protein [Thermoplasmatota archaeon]